MRISDLFAIDRNTARVIRWLDALELSPVELAVFIMYVRHFDDGLGRFPGVRAIKTRFHISERTIAKTKRTLREKGLIRVFSDPPSGRADRAQILRMPRGGAAEKGG